MAKKDIHPKYYEKTKIKCACGAEFNFGATKDKMEVEICSACHPLYTGKQKFLDAAGRMEKFKKRVEKSEKMKKEAKEKTKTKTKKEK